MRDAKDPIVEPATGPRHAAIFDPLPTQEAAVMIDRSRRPGLARVDVRERVGVFHCNRVTLSGPAGSRTGP